MGSLTCFQCFVHHLHVVSPTILCTLLQLTSKADKLPPETEPVDSNNNMNFTFKLGNSTDNHSVK